MTTSLDQIKAMDARRGTISTMCNQHRIAIAQLRLGCRHCFLPNKARCEACPATKSIDVHRKAIIKLLSEI